MKKIFKCLPFYILIPCCGLITANQVKNPTYAAKDDLQYTQSPLPTDINLNDYADSEIRQYYNGLSSLSESERKGQNLLKNLKPILMNNQKYYSYDSGSGKSNSIWKIYEIADRDWNKSPASELGSKYDANTNCITDYSYTTTDPYVHALYVDRNIDNPKTAWGNHDSRGNIKCIEREHIWPKSHGFDATEASGARGDPMHLWAADGYSNGIHSNNFYGNVDTTRSYSNCHNSTHEWVGNNLSGYPKSDKSSTLTVFEPQDCDKGDIARACFYMVARYNNIAGNDTQINSANPNLSLTNDVNKSKESGTSTATNAYSLGILSDLLEWNKLDPVDDYEIHRNNLLCRNFTNNRNPFIDFPDWADVIWGDQSNSANPQSDNINGLETKEKNTITSFVVNDVPYGTAVSPSASALSGSVTFTYSTSENGTFTETQPTDSGVYYVKATSKSTSEYSPDSVIKTFRIIGDKKNTIIKFEIADITAGEYLKINALALNGDVEVTYSTSEDGVYTSEKPTEPGTYYAKAVSINKGPYETETKIIQFRIIDPNEGKIFGFEPTTFYIIVGVAALVLLILIIVYANASKKNKKKMMKSAKKVAKSVGITTSKSPSSKKNSSSKKKTK